jgi:hypothetical protein
MAIKTGFTTDYTLGSANKFDFYSGSQITVWFGNILIDDINAIQWNRSQSKRPIYGYASQQFDAVAKGTVIIQGNFTINFRQRGYLSAVMLRIKDLYKKFSEDGNTTEEKAKWDSSRWPVVRDLIGMHLRNGTFGPQTVEEITALGESPDFFELAKFYEELIWGEGALYGDEGKETKSPVDVYQQDLLSDGFNILITYGNTSGSEARTLQDQLQSTTKTLNGVHLIGESQVIQVGGQPVLEQYDFIARGTDEYIGTTR